MSFSLGGVVSGLGGAVSGLMGMMGSDAAASGYDQAANYFGQAAGLAEQNAQYEVTNEDIANMQETRKFYSTLGTATADQAGNGLQLHGSFYNVMANTAQQDALEHTMIGVQSNININGYNEQAMGLLAQQSEAQAAASAAKDSGMGSMLGGVLGLVGSFL